MEFQVGVVVDHVPELGNDKSVKISGGSTVDQPAGELAGEVPMKSANELALVPVRGHDVGVVKNVSKRWRVRWCACAC